MSTKNNALLDHYVKRILSARVYDVASETRLHAAPQLGRRMGNEVWLKREDEQSIFSFKCRGAYNNLFNLQTQRTAEGAPLPGVIAASAGNHAQGVALAARKLGLPAMIVMPSTTPQIKIEAVRSLGAEAVLHGDDFYQALAHAEQEAVRLGYPFIHPYDNPDTIAGQGTVAVEICRQHPGPIHAIFIPIGGGGLAAGMCAYLKYLRPEIKIIGVEPVDAACMHAAMNAGERITLDQVGLFADGVAVRQAGAFTYEICKDYLDDIVLISVDEMSTAIKDIFTETRTLTEPAGALAVAGLKRYAQEHSLVEKSLVAVVSGANINFDRLRHVAERAEIGESREALFAVTLPEKPGSFKRFCKALGHRSITEFNYRYADSTRAVVFAGVEVAGGAEERASMVSELRIAGYDVLDMTKNDTAKLHIRHMIGGHANLPSEHLYRFRFPERPGALLHFLSSMDEGWNISLFHYRNHGAAYGRVLVGMQLPNEDEGQLAQFIEELGFSGELESDNEAYKLFLKTDQN